MLYLLSMLKRILIADDDPGIVDAVEMLLSFYNYEVSSTYDGNEVADIVTQLNPDLILLDIWMSGVDGRDICRKLKDNAQTCSVPVLMISASKDIASSALEAGANGFVAKPFDMQQLISKIEELLSSDSAMGQKIA